MSGSADIDSTAAAEDSEHSTHAPASGPRARFVVRLGQFFFARRSFVFSGVFLLLIAVSSPIAFGGRPATDCWLDAAGVLVASLGQALRALVIGLAYIRRGGRNKAIYADDLVTDGFFAHSRNPLYLGNMLVYLGLFLILNSVVGWVAGVPFFLAAYLCITAAEEDYLARRFGAAYRAYCQRVPRFLPRLAGLGATTRGMRFQWRRLIRKEYGSTYAWTVTVLLLLAYERLLWSGSAASWAQLRWLALAWGLLTVLYVAARWLKKTRRLEDC